MKKHFQEMHYSILVYLTLLLVIVWASYGIFSEEKEPDPIKVSVVVEDSSNARWTVFRLGLETAAKDKNVELNYIPTTDFADMKDEWNLIDNIKGTTDGIILDPVSSEGMDEYYDPLSWELSLGFVNSDVEKGSQVDDNIILLAPDYEKIAQSLYSQIEEDLGGNLKGKKVVFYSIKQDQLATTILFNQLTESFERAGGKCLGLVSYKDLEKKEKSEADILIGLDDSSLLYLAKELSAKKKELHLYGIGISESCVYYLDKNIIDGMIVVDDFNMGYESISRIAENIRNKYTEIHGLEVDYYMIRSDNVHDQKIENLLFPVIQ